MGVSRIFFFVSTSLVMANMLLVIILQCSMLNAAPESFKVRFFLFFSEISYSVELSKKDIL